MCVYNLSTDLPKNDKGVLFMKKSGLAKWLTPLLIFLVIATILGALAEPGSKSKHDEDDD